MVEFFERLHPLVQTLIAGIFTWWITAAGAMIGFLLMMVLDVALG